METIGGFVRGRSFVADIGSLVDPQGDIWTMSSRPETYVAVKSESIGMSHCRAGPPGQVSIDQAYEGASMIEAEACSLSSWSLAILKKIS